MMMETLILCIGNQEGGDDGIGPYIAQRLKNDSSHDMILDCGTIPENYTGVIKRHRPKTLILIDAAEMGLPPGEMRIIPREKLGTMHLSTHGIPLSVFIQYLEKEVPRIIFIGIQPETLQGKMSNPVKKSGEELIRLLQKKKIMQISVL
ncbi:MAG: hydrogenase maturation peptidase HycI [Euryarchaeota archaeon]|jgi:hydrogenase 3 maturation protease|nr:hydrogenase maturation peptidase HycI [Euryarchaeota archaeon]